MSEKVLIDRELLAKATMLPSMRSMKANRRDIEERRRAQAEIRKILAAAQAEQEPVAWMTHHDEPMFFSVEKEAAAYCDNDESPIPLYAAPPAHPGAPRCQCCGYLVTESEHRGCLRSASPHPDASVLVEALRAARHLLALHSGEAMPAYDAMQVVDRIDAALAGKGGDQ